MFVDQEKNWRYLSCICNLRKTSSPQNNFANISPRIVSVNISKTVDKSSVVQFEYFLRNLLTRCLLL